MDRRGFVTSGMAAGLAGATASSAALGSVFDRIPGWAPGKTLQDGTIKLSSNENPLGLSPAAREALIAAIPQANRYPNRQPLLDRRSLSLRPGAAATVQCQCR